MQIKLRNNTNWTSIVGRQVKLDPTKPNNFIYANYYDDLIIGTVANAVPQGNQCLINLLNTVAQTDITGYKATNISTTPYNIIATDIYIYVDTTVGDITVNLPLATGSGRFITIKKVAGANDVIITADATGTPDMIDGNPTETITVLNASIVIHDGIVDNWYII